VGAFFLKTVYFCESANKFLVTENIFYNTLKSKSRYISAEICGQSAKYQKK